MTDSHSMMEASQGQLEGKEEAEDEDEEKVVVVEVFEDREGEGGSDTVFH